MLGSSALRTSEAVTVSPTDLEGHGPSVWPCWDRWLSPSAGNVSLMDTELKQQARINLDGHRAAAQRGQGWWP